MIYVAISVSVFVALSSLIQGVIVAAYVRLLYSSKQRVRRVTNLPKAAVVFSVRGPDPFLEANLSALMQQDYPDFTVFVIVDSMEDPAWPIVQRVYESARGLVDIQVLEHPPLATCSLKCGSLAQVVENLDPSYEVVAFLDGDARPHEDWLRDLVAPLREARVGVATGNRCYLPQVGGWGSLVRYFWNAGAIVQVWLNGIIWAGSMAMRRDVMQEVGMVAAWRRALSVDATVVRQLRGHGYKAQFVPSVMMANYEEITLASYIPWAERQMVAAKSCGSNFRFVTLHAINILCCLTLPVVFATAGWLNGDFQVTWISLAGMASFWLSAALSTLAIELGVRHVLAVNHVDSSWLNWRTVVRLLPALVMTYFVYLRILAGAFSCHRVSWRGVEYEIRGVNNIHMVAYHPFQAPRHHELIKSVV